MTGCQGLSGIAVAWEQGSPIYRGASWGRLSEAVSSWVAGLPSGYSGVLFIVGEWGLGKSLAASVLEPAAKSHGFKFRVVSGAFLRQSLARGLRGFLEALVGGLDDRVIAFIDQAEDVILSSSGAWRILEALGALLDPRDPQGEEFRGRLHVAIALTPVSLDRLLAELAARERLGWLLRRVSIIELHPLSKLEVVNLVSEAAHSAGLDGLGQLVSKPELASAFYWASAGNPGVTLKLLRDLGAGTCPLGALDLLERLSRVVIPSRHGVALTGFDEAALSRIKSVGSSCGRLEEIAILAAGGFVPAAPDIAWCASQAGVHVVEAVLLEGVDPAVFVEEAARSACGSSFECRREAVKAAAELVHPTRGGWAVAVPDVGWRGLSREVLEAAARAAGGRLSGKVLVARLEAFERMYPRLAAPPVPFIRDPGVAAAVYAAVSEALHSGGFERLAAQGMARLLRAAGYASAGRLRLKWAGGTYLAPFRVAVAREGEDLAVDCEGTRVTIILAPEGWSGGNGGQGCPNVIVVRAPFGILRLIGMAGYLASSNVPSVDWASLDSQLASAARELWIPALLDRLASRLGEAGILVPPNPPASRLSPSAAQPAAKLALLAEAFGGVEELRQAIERVQRLLAPLPGDCPKRPWAPLEWASKVTPAPLDVDAAAEAARVALEILRSEGILAHGGLALDRNPVAARVARGARIEAFIPPEESRDEALRALQVYSVLAGLSSQPEPPREAGILGRAVESLEAAGKAVASELGLNHDEADLLAHVILGSGRIVPASTYFMLLDWLKSRITTWNKATVEALHSLEEHIASRLRIAETALINNLRQLKSFRPSNLEAEVEALRSLYESARERARGLASLAKAVYEYYSREADSLKWPKLKESATWKVRETMQQLRTGRVPGSLVDWMSRSSCNTHGGNVAAASLALALEEARRKAAVLTRGARKAKAELAKIISLYSKLEKEGLGRVLSTLKPPLLEGATSQRSILRAIEAIRVELESLAANSRLLARLEEEAERKAQILEELTSKLVKEADSLKSRALNVLKTLENVREGIPPHLNEYIARLAGVAEEALRASAEAVEFIERLMGNARDVLELMASARSSAAIDAAERAVLRLGGIIDEVNAFKARISSLNSSLSEAQREFLKTVEAEALAIVEKIKVIQEAFGVPPINNLSRAELSALAAASHAKEGRLGEALTALIEAVKALDDTIARGATGVSKLELLVYMAVRRRGRLQVSDLAKEAEKLGVSEEEMIRALIGLHRRGLVRLEVLPSF